MPSSRSVAVSVLRALQPGEFALGGGFYESEGKPGDLLPRWSGSDPQLLFYPDRPGEMVIHMRLSQPALEDYVRSVPKLRYIWNGQQGLPGSLVVQLPEDSTYRMTYDMTMTIPEPEPGPNRLELLTDTFEPKDWEPGSQDARELGLRIDSLSVEVDGAPQRFVNAAAPPPPDEDAIRAASAASLLGSPANRDRAASAVGLLGSPSVTGLLR